MVVTGFSNAAKLICALLLTAFLGQLLLAQAEHAGWISCCQHHDDSISGHPVSKDEAPPTGGHCHCCCLGMELPRGADLVIVGFFAEGQAFPLWNQIIPDGPVESIEQPPQIS